MDGLEMRSKSQLKKWKRDTKEGNCFKSWETRQRNKMKKEYENRATDVDYEAIVAMLPDTFNEDKLIEAIDRKYSKDTLRKKLTNSVFKKGSPCNP